MICKRFNNLFFPIFYKYKTRKKVGNMSNKLRIPADDKRAGIRTYAFNVWNGYLHVPDKTAYFDKAVHVYLDRFREMNLPKPFDPTNNREHKRILNKIVEKDSEDVIKHLNTDYKKVVRRPGFEILSREEKERQRINNNQADGYLGMGMKNLTRAVTGGGLLNLGLGLYGLHKSRKKRNKY